MFFVEIPTEDHRKRKQGLELFTARVVDKVDASSAPIIPIYRDHTALEFVASLDFR